MRMQILELPSVQVGEAYETPFVIVIDDVQRDEVKSVQGEVVRTSQRIDPVTLENLRQQVGAKAVFVSPEPVEIVR